jgi:hypothetical protein
MFLKENGCDQEHRVLEADAMSGHQLLAAGDAYLAGAAPVG